jgi:RHS repeat-associated protein
MRSNKGIFKVFSYTLAVAMLVSFMPGNLSGKPLDFSGFGEEIVQVVKSTSKAISDIDIHFDFGADNKDDQEPPSSKKVVVQVDPDKDIEIKSASEKITLKIPKGAVDKKCEIEFIEYTPSGSTGMVMLSNFELNAKGKDSGKAFSKFEKDLEITIKHEPEELTGIDIDSIRLYYLDENTGQWTPMATDKYDSKEKTIKATIDHFTYYGEQANPLQVGPGRVNAAQVSLSSGAATFSYPFELPPGPGGFTPKLELTYNSGSVDEMKNKQAVGSWVGIGWNLHLGRISYDATNKQYFLDLSGASYQIFSTDGLNFYTNPEEYLKITRNYENGDTWIVLDREGNYYRFGGTTDSQQYVISNEIATGYRWDLNLIKDTSCNQAIVTYIQNPEGTWPNDYWIRSAYPEYVTYGNVQVHFTCSYDESTFDGYLRYDNPITKSNDMGGYYIVNYAPKIMENRKLDSIEVKVNNTLIRKYNFSYTTTQRVYSSDYSGVYYSGKHTLTSITQVGADGTSQLPAMTFSYGDLQIHRHTSETSYNGNPGNPANLYWPHITEVKSGYGASVSFTYKQLPGTSMLNTWTREIVTAKTINSGIGAYEASIYNYIGNPQYLYPGWDQKYRGFNEVEEMDSSGNSIKHWFYTTGQIDGRDGEKLTGKEYKTQWFDSGDVLLKEKTYDWSAFATSQDYNAFLIWGSGIVWSGVNNYLELSNNYIYVVAGSVKKYNEHGNYISSHGWSESAIAIDSNGFRYGFSVWPEFNICSVLKYDANGNQVLQWGNCGTGDGQFQNPYNIAVDNSGYIYVGEGNPNPRIQKFDSNGNFIKKWGSSGTGPGQFCYAVGDIAFDSNNHIYVSDAAPRIQKFDSNGNFILQWGSYGSGDGQFQNPAGIAIDDNNNIYVADYGNHRVQKFDASGNFLSKYGKSGTGPGEVKGPTSIVTLYSTLYVVEGYSTQRIQEFTNNWAVRLNKVEETIGDKTTKTEYVYDDYGNVITEKVHGDISTYEDDTTIWRTFYPNTTANILSKLARERVYATIVTEDNGGSNLKKETCYYYDGNNTLLTTPPTKSMLTRVENKKDASNSISSYITYDTYGNVLTTTDANGNDTALSWDTTYHTYLISKTYPISGLSESYEYYTSGGNIGQLWKMTNANAQVTECVYDTFQRMIKVIKPGDTTGSPSIEYQYNNWGTIRQQSIKTITKINGNSSVWQADYFDGLGRVVQTQAQGESGHTIVSNTVAFNNCGLVHKQFVSQDIASSLTQYYSPRSSWKYTTYIYDGLGRVTILKNADNTMVLSDYAMPWQVDVTNPRGFISRYYYDAFGQLVKVEEPNESDGVYATTKYTYDTLGNLTQVVDANSNVTSMSYDWLSRKTAMTDPDMGSWSYDYDNNGNLTSQTDAKSQTITVVYDTLNRLTNKNYPQGSGMTDVVCTYDSISGGNYGKGLRTGMTDAGGTNSYKYDTRGRLVEEKRTVDSVDYTTGYTYDGLDRAVTVTYPTGETVTNTYNGRGLPNTVSGSTAGSLVTSTLYNQLGAITEISLGNGVKTTYGYYGTGGTYDTTGGYYSRLWEIRSAKDSTTLQDIKHTWDAIGNLTQRQDLVSSETENFTYDFLDRLTWVSGAYTQSYTYNTIGNITAMNGNSYTYGTKPHAVTTVGSTSYVYDSNGNMTTRGTQTIGWDVENRVISVTGGASFIYDGDGNRVKKTEGGQTILYINQYYEKNLTTSVITTSYYLGGKLIAQKEGSTLRYVHQDSLNSTSVMTTSTGTLDSSMTFYPFGDCRNSQGEIGTDRLFTGQRLDDTGLYYYGARYYDCTIGRFISADTIVQSFSNPQTLNRYSYVTNNPLKYTDPSGHVNVADDWGGWDVKPELPIKHPTVFGFLVRLADIILHPAEWGGETVVNSILAPTGVSVDITPSIVDKQSIPASQLQAYETGSWIADVTVQTGIAIGIGCAIKSPAVKPNPLEGVTYSDRVLIQMGKGDYHSFPKDIDSLAVDGKITKGFDRMGRLDTQIKLEGIYDGKKGTFEWAINYKNELYHRFFRPYK